MAEPLTWQILEWLRDRLRAIRIADGYHTDLGAGQFSLDGEQVDEALPVTTIDGGAVATIPEKSGSRRTTSALSITIEYSVPVAVGASAKKLAHRARADIVRVLNQPARFAPVGVGGASVIGSQILPTESGAAAIVAQVTARAVLSESASPA